MNQTILNVSHSVSSLFVLKALYFRQIIYIFKSFLAKALALEQFKSSLLFVYNLINICTISS